jgi:hypothetical protein
MMLFNKASGERLIVGSSTEYESYTEEVDREVEGVVPEATGLPLYAINVPFRLIEYSAPNTPTPGELTYVLDIVTIGAGAIDIPFIFTGIKLSPEFS